VDCILETCQICVADDCPTDADKSMPGQCGCGIADTDTDNDLIADCVDPDDDDDGFDDGNDCAPLDATAWSTPGEARQLLLSHVGGGGGNSTLNWLAPLDQGGSAVVYDVISSLDPANFNGGASCVEGDSVDAQSIDSFTPLSTELIFFLVRAENVCEEGGLGTTSSGVNRTGRSCS